MPVGRPRGRSNLAEDLGARLAARAVELRPVDDGTTWPSAKYRADPVTFAREVLGIELWSRQIEVVEAIRDNLRVAVSSGNKIGKTTLVAVVALWYFCSFPDARVWLTASTAKQVTQAVWREIKRLIRRAESRGFHIGNPAQHAGSGLEAPDGRQIVGFSAKTKEGAQGISGENMMYVIDEASGLDEAIYDAIQGNRAGGGVRIVAIGNPTRNEGFFYRAFKDPNAARLWKTFRISGEETPNATGTGWVPGLQSREWIDEIIAEHGRDSATFKIRVEGKFVEGEEGKVISLHALYMAQRACLDAPANGPLVIGLDVAGPGQGGDETVFAPLRDLRCPAIHGHRGLTTAEIIAHLEGYLTQYLRSSSELAIVAVDGEGAIGAEVSGALRAAAALPGARFRVVVVRSGQRATRLPMVYEMIRDELWASCARWLKDGGGIPEHSKLERDLHAPAWERSIRGREKVTAKDEIKKALGRSPDYGDALCLAIWCRAMDPMTIGADSDARRGSPAPPPRREGPIDPWGSGDAIDPYGLRLAA